MMEILGYALACVIGLVMGALGGGGAMLAVPILVFIFGIKPELATAYSLFIVGSTALVSTIPNTYKGLVAFREGLIFAIPSLVVSYAMRWLVKALPAVWMHIGAFELTKDVAIMIGFVAVMIPVGWTMVRKSGSSLRPNKVHGDPQVALVIGQGAATGLVTGFVGAGGGFLIVPALSLLVGLPIRKAIATSLMIIALNALGSFVADIQAAREIDWKFLLSFTALTIVGILVGGKIAEKLPAKKLSVGFGYFIFLMAALILILELTGLRK